jgi:hypothetical protein
MERAIFRTGLLIARFPTNVSTILNQLRARSTPVLAGFDCVYLLELETSLEGYQVFEC